jgi:hypothetical protein
MQAPNTAVEAGDDTEDSILPLDQLIAIAGKSGLRLRSANLDWRALLIATATTTVLLLLRNGNVVVVLGTGREGVEEIVVSDPLYQNGESFFLPRLALENAWDGEALIAEPKRSRMERAITWCISTLSFFGFAAAIVLLCQVAIASFNARFNSEATSSNRSDTASSSNKTKPGTDATDGNAQPSADAVFDTGSVTQVGTVSPQSASPESIRAVSAAEVQKIERPPTELQQRLGGSVAEAAASSPKLPATIEGEARKSEEPSASTVAQSPVTDAVPATASSSSFSTADSTALLVRGDALIAKGDVASARLFYERAADAGDGQAALRLGESYDPTFLARAHLSAVRGDTEAAAHWYRRARELGTAEAEALLQTVGSEKDHRLP